MSKMRSWATLSVILTLLTVNSTGAEDVSGKTKPYAKDAVQHYNEAVRLHESGFASQAISEYRAALEADNRMEEAWSNLGVIYFWEKKYQEASDAIQKAIALNPRRALNFNSYGEVLNSMGKTKEARQAWQHALLLDPTIEPARSRIKHDEPPAAGSSEEVRQFIKGRSPTIHGVE
jgi:tetratricopeptide (TPR) repeat protein